MAKYTYEQIVKIGKDKGSRPSDINYTLKKYGISRRYNPVTDVDNWKNLIPNAASNAKGMARDAKTFGGYVISPIIDADYAMHNTKGRGIDKLAAAKDAFIKSINDDKYRKTLGGALVGGIAGTFIPKVGTIGGALTGAGIGMSGSPKEFANALLSTYNTNLDELKSGNARPEDIIQGLFDNPLYAALDTAPIYGPKLTKGVGKSLDNAPLALRQLFPDEKARAFNRQITNSLTSARAKGQKNYQGILNLEASNGIDRERLVKNILTNDISNMSQQELLLAETIKNNLRDVENEFTSRGYADPSEFRDNTRAQYVMYSMPDLGELVHDDIYNIIRGENLRTGNKLPEQAKIDEIKRLADIGGDLYDNKKISWLSQQLAPITDEYGNVVARDLVGNTKNYFDTNRIIGKQSTSKLANVLDRTIKAQLDHMGQFIDVEDTINNLANSFEQGSIKTLNAGEKTPIGKTPFSIRAFKEYVNKHGSNVDIAEAIRNSKIEEAGAYLLDNLYVDMINNAFTKNLGKQRKLLNAFKKAVLGNPHWVVLNRIGNMTNNLMDGVTLFDYKDVKRASQLGIIPEELQYQTSFGAYINMLEGADSIQGINKATKGYGSAVNVPLNRLKQAYDKFKDSKKSLGDYGELIKQAYINTSDVTANPWYKLEASLEYADRAANMIKQAKEYGKIHNVSWEDVLRKAQNDTRLFSELNTKVNKALGDYVGRNYAISPKFYGLASEMVPFYRFVTQTGRTTAHQLAHNPIGFMANVTAPPRVGYNLSNEYVQKYGLDPEQYEGGIPYLQEKDEKGNTKYRVYGFEPLPFASVAEQFTSPSRAASMFGPYTTSLPFAMAFMNRYGRTATSPKQTEMRLNGENTYGKRYDPTLGEYLALLGNTLLTNTHNMARITSKELPEVLASVGIMKGMHTPYDTNAWRPNEESYKKTLPSELVGRWLGLQTRQVGKYKPRKPSKTTAIKTANKIKRNREKE